ncbi:MAG: ACT domain-containing protein [Pirellulaceae bacterium]
MEKQRLYVVHGMGNDEVGLVGHITAAIARAGGNVVDLRQDVLHGLFTIYMVVDLADCDLDLAGFQSMIGQIGDETNLAITVDRYTPVPRSPQKKNLLMICIGRDQPGIIATSSEMLGKYNANIEFSQTIGREGVFLMELLTDVSDVSIPVENLKRTVSRNMEALNIQTVFQDEHVFIKRKRVVLFNLASSFLASATLGEILNQTSLSPRDISRSYSRSAPISSVQAALSKLDGLPLDVLHTVLAGITPTPGCVELIQTLKVMGYRIALVSTGLSLFTDHVRALLDIDYAYGMRHEVDDDERALIGELVTDEPGSHDIDAVLSHLAGVEHVDREDITTITDEGCSETLGIRLDFDLEILLECFNQHAMSPENMLGLLGSFGIPTVA